MVQGEPLKTAMTAAEKQLVSLMRAYMHHSIPEDHMLRSDQALWVRLFELAESHKLTPAAFDRLSVLPDIGERMPSFLYEKWKQRARALTVKQTRFDAELASILDMLDKNGICYALVKGAFCRTLYQNGALRISSDEDIIAAERDFPRACTLFTQLGFTTADVPDKADVVHFRKPNGFYIELHKNAFGDDASLNGLFEEALSSRIKWNLGFCCGYTFSPTENFLMLVLHAKKHFIAGGFGLRTLADIAKFAILHGKAVDWEKAEAVLKEHKAFRFVQALFSLAEAFLGFSHLDAGCPEWFVGKENEEALFSDILDAGIYGKSSMSRIHSANMTAAASKKGKKTGVAAALFPKAEVVKRRYRYLDRYPVLLPFAYVQRMFGYAYEVAAGEFKDNRPDKSIRIAEQRMKLLQKYGMIE